MASFSHVTPLVLTVVATCSSLSKTATFAPAFDAAYAAEEPAGPHPATMTSYGDDFNSTLNGRRR